MAPKMGEGDQIWLKCITGDLIMMKREKNNIFERVENFHADLAWNYPCAHYERAKQVCTLKEQRRGRMLMLARHLLPRGRCSAALCISTVVATACQPLRLEPH